jgi:hypothetical protein
LRYARGIVIGAIISGIIFIGSTLINIAGVGITDPATLTSLWNIFEIWFVVSVALIVVPLGIVYFKNRDGFKEFFFLDFGAIMFSTPFWFILAAELSGVLWVDVLLNGVDGAIPFFDEFGGITGLRIGSIILIPSFVVMLLLGAFILRPSFIAKHTAPIEPRELTDLKKDSTPTTMDPIEAEMSEIKPPVPDEHSMKELRVLLAELAVPEAAINAIMNAGFATVTDLVATSPEQISQASGLDANTTQDIHLAVQKRVWFGGI